MHNRVIQQHRNALNINNTLQVNCIRLRYDCFLRNYKIAYINQIFPLATHSFWNKGMQGANNINRS